MVSVTRGSLIVSIISISLMALVGCGEEGQQNCEIEDQGDGSAVFDCPDGEVELEDGEDGEPGEDGPDGVDCSVDDDAEGGILVSCEDGTETLIEHGEDGEDGEDGSSCSIEDNDDGTYDLTCESGLEVSFHDGEDAEDGEDGEDGYGCDLFLQTDGYLLSCTDGTEVLLPDDGGDEGCQVDDNDDGTATVDCAGSDEVTLDLRTSGYEFEIFSVDFSADGDGDAEAVTIVKNVGAEALEESSIVNFWFDESSEPSDSLTDDSNEAFIEDFEPGDVQLFRGSDSVSDSGTLEGWTSISYLGSNDIIEIQGPITYSADP